MDGWIFFPSFLKTMALHGEELMSQNRKTENHKGTLGSAPFYVKVSVSLNVLAKETTCSLFMTCFADHSEHEGERTCSPHD